MSTPAPAPAYPYPEPVRYPQLLRTPTFRPWRPVVGAIGLLLAVFVVASLVLLPLLAIAVYVESAIDGTDFSAAMNQAVGLKTITPASMLWLNLTLGSGTLVVFALLRWLHHLRPRWATSVLPGMRWKFFLACLPISVVALLLNVVLASLLPIDDTGETVGSVNHLGGQALAFTLVIVLTTPLQAMGEEYVFRGYLLQAVGSMFKRWTSVASAASLLATALLFAAFHGTQNFPLFFDRFAFGVLAAYLVVKVGGLEGGIALHVVNNFFAYGFALLFGDISSSLNTTETSWWNVPVTVVQSVFYLVAVLSVARRMGLRGETAPAPAPIGDARA